jgi:hypothetical protein
MVNGSSALAALVLRSGQIGLGKRQAVGTVKYHQMSIKRLTDRSQAVIFVPSGVKSKQLSPRA